MTAANILLFAAALLVAAGSPGPSVAALVSRVITRGMGDVLPFLAALWVGEAIWLSLAVWGLAAVAQSFATVFLVIKWLGVAYLLFLAWKMWHAPLPRDGETHSPAGSPLKMLLAGLAVSLGNPKTAAFYLALLPTILDLRTISLAGWLELTAVMFAVLAVVDLAWAFAAHQARGFLRSPRAMRNANRTSAGMMAGAAAAIAAR